MFNIPSSTRPGLNRHDDLRIPVPTFARATETIYNLDAPLAPTGHPFHGVLGDLPPNHIIPDSISRWMPYYHRERLYFTTNLATRTFPRDVSCIRIPMVKVTGHRRPRSDLTEPTCYPRIIGIVDLFYQNHLSPLRPHHRPHHRP
jgi:hypothetical protein